MLVVWTDTRSDAGDLYGRAITDFPPADPAPGTDGDALVVGAGNQRLPAVAEVVAITIGASPVFFGPAHVVAYEEEIFVPQSSREIRAVRVGDLDWGPNGVPVHEPGVLSGTDPAVTADDEFGAIVAWTEIAPGVRASRLQRLGFLGTREWGPNGVTLGSDTTVSGTHQLAGGPGGRTYVLRSDRRNGALSGSARALALFCVDGWGVIAPGWPAEGLLLGDLTTGPHRLLPDGGGGVYVVWQQAEILSKDGIGQGVRVAHILSDGEAAPGWSLGGTPAVVRADGNVRLGAADVLAGFGPVLVLTYEQVVGGPSASGQDLVAQRMQTNGQLAPGWPVTGIDLCTAPGGQHGVQVIASGAGLLAVWSDDRASSTDLYGVRLEGDGTPASGWSAGGVLLCNAPGDQVAVTLAPATGNGAVFAWEDSRDFISTQTDVYAQTVNAVGQVDVPAAAPSTLWLSAAWPQPASASARLRISGPAGDAAIEVLDTQGRTVTAWRDAVTAGGSSIRWDLADRDGRRVAPGVYQLRVRLGTFAAARRIVVVR